MALRGLLGWARVAGKWLVATDRAAGSALTSSAAARALGVQIV
jgi:hypothetical protein